MLLLAAGFVQLKIVREAETRQARVEEANLLADEILSLRGVPANRLEDEARARLRKIAVSMFGESMAGEMLLKPSQTLPSEEKASR